MQEFSKSSTGLSKVTALPNGVRVASENTPGHFSAVGVYVDAGSRYESPANQGVSHILDRLAFKVMFVFKLAGTVYTSRLISSEIVEYENIKC